MLRILYIFYFAVIFLNVFLGALQFKKMDKALRVFYMLVVAIFVNEVIATYFEEVYKNSSRVSHIYSIFELALTTIYFLYTIFPKPKKFFIILSILISILFGAIDMALQKNEYNNYMLVVESLLICPQALYVLYTISNRDDIPKLSQYPHFFIWRSLLVLWSVTFFYWAFLIYIKESNEYPIVYIYYIIFNILVYIPIGTTFLSLKEKEPITNQNLTK